MSWAAPAPAKKPPAPALKKTVAPPPSKPVADSSAAGAAQAGEPAPTPTPSAPAVAAAPSGKGVKEKAPTVSVTLREVDASGRLTELTPARTAKFEWGEWPADPGRLIGDPTPVSSPTTVPTPLASPGASPSPSPVASSASGAPQKIEFKAPTLFPTLSFSAPTVGKARPAGKKDGIRFASVADQVVQLESREINGTVEFLEPPTPQNKTERKRSLIWTAASSAPVLLVAPSCDDFGIYLDPTQTGAAQLPKIPYVGIYCEERGKSVDISIFLPANGRMGTTDLGVPEPPLPAGAKNSSIKDLTAAARPRVGRPFAEGRFWKMFRVPEPRAGWGKPARLGVIAIQEASSSQSADLAVMVDPSRIPSKRFSATLGLGVTALYYAEEPVRIHLTQVPLTIKGSLNYEFVRNMFEAHLSSYFNVVNFFKIPSTVADARFLGVNARVDYIFPFKSAFKMKFGLGWYVWTMLVSDNSFGVKYLTGPESMLGMSFPIGSRRMGWYFKYAPISASTSGFGFSNYELATGLNFQLTAPRFWPPILLTLDGSALRVDRIEGVQNTIQLYTLSLGGTVVF